MAIEKRPAQTMGAIVLILTTAGLADFFDVRQVNTTRNFMVVPIIQAGGPTPYTELNDFQKLEKFKEAITALHDAGYSHKLTDGSIEHVGASFRFTDPKTRAFRPRFYVNEKPYDKEKAAAQSDVRNIMENGTADEKRAVAELLNKLRNKDVAVGEVAQPVDDDEPQL